MNSGHFLHDLSLSKTDVGSHESFSHCLPFFKDFRPFGQVWHVPLSRTIWCGGLQGSEVHLWPSDVGFRYWGQH